MESNVPNLDCMSSDELLTFAERFKGGRDAGRIFPGRNPEEATRAASLLAAYASVKAGAMRDRSIGEVRYALVKERRADELYGVLPDWARW